MDMSDTRLKEIAVAIGAPMNPKRMGCGPQTANHDQRCEVMMVIKIDLRTQKEIEDCVDRRNYKDDAGGYCK